MEALRKVPELLAPAGDMEKLIMAVRYGADAVYMAGSEFGMRAAAGNFEGDMLRKAIDFCHKNGVRAYVTLNTVAHNDEIPRIEVFAEYVQEAGADAVIVTDPGVMSIVKRYAPRCDIHISTQAGVTNYAAANMWHELGAKRVILARELTLDEIRGIREKTPDTLEVECFVHGAMCVSFSGRCLLSNYMAGRDANRGACAQPCRWKYYLREERREGDNFEIQEHPEGTYIMNSKDMRTIDFLGEIVGAGVDSLKIEGRAKSSYYAAAVTHAYRGALDDLIAGRPFDKRWMDETEKVSHREYCGGFYHGAEQQPMQHYGDSSYIRDWDVCAVVESCDSLGNAVVLQKNRFSPGETMELLVPQGGTQSFVVGQVRDPDGNRVDIANHPHMLYTIKLPVEVPKYSVLRKCVKA